MHEILTLQLGPSANFLSTHYFNALESYFTFDPSAPPSSTNHNISFFAGQTPNGDETFLPRTLIYDLKHAFGSLKKVNALYEVDVAESGFGGNLWDKDPVVLEEPKIESSRYVEALNEGADPSDDLLAPSSVKFWSDYARTFYHPTSLNPIPLLALPTPSKSLDDYALGKVLYETLSTRANETLVESDFHHQAEAADNFQGVNVVAETDSGWAGFAGEYISDLMDEYPKKEVWVWGIEDSLDGLDIANRRRRAVNQALAFPGMVELVSLFVPLVSPPKPSPWLQGYVPSSKWHSASILSVALETALLPSRVEKSGMGMSEIGSFMRMGAEGENEKRNIVQTVLGGETTSQRIVLGWDDKAIVASTTQKKPSDHVFSRLKIYRSVADAVPMNGVQDDEIDNDLTWHPSERSIPMPRPTSFPNIFRAGEEVQSVTLSTRTAPVVAKMDYLKAMAAVYVGVEDREELVHQLGRIRESYVTGYEDSDEEWDD